MFERVTITKETRWFRLRLASRRHRGQLSWRSRRSCSTRHSRSEDTPTCAPQTRLRTSRAAAFSVLSGEATVVAVMLMTASRFATQSDGVICVRR